MHAPGDIVEVDLLRFYAALIAHLEHDDNYLNRLWDSLLVCFLIQAAGWVVEAGRDDQTLLYGFA
jgi:hypothetical protein